LNVPDGYEIWHAAILDFVEHRGNVNITPDTADAKVWKTFEIMTCKLIPRVCL
jgi:hypothetical protein